MPEQGNPPVRLKGVGDSLWVTFDPTLTLEELKAELNRPFERLKHLAVNARVILDPGSHENNNSLINELGEYLRVQFQVGTVSAPPEKPQPDESLQRTGDLTNAWHNRRSEALIIAGRVRSGQKIQAEKHLVILGDLNPGAEAIAGGDIIILGALKGTAIAGQPDNEDAIIIAMDFRPTQIQIGGLAAAGEASSSGKGNTLEFARIDQNQIIVMDYTEANPFKRLAWPEVR